MQVNEHNARVTIKLAHVTGAESNRLATLFGARADRIDPPLNPEALAREARGQGVQIARSPGALGVPGFLDASYVHLSVAELQRGEKVPSEPFASCLAVYFLFPKLRIRAKGMITHFLMLW